MTITRSHVWMLLIAALLSGLLHVWIRFLGRVDRQFRRLGRSILRCGSCIKLMELGTRGRGLLMLTMGLLTLSLMVPSGCQSYETPGLSLKDARLAEGPVIIQRGEHFYLRYRR